VSLISLIFLSHLRFSEAAKVKAAAVEVERLEQELIANAAAHIIEIEVC